MSSLAVLTGLDPRVVADLDEDEFGALVEAVREQRQAEAWDNTHEVLASVVEALWMILARLEAGVPMVQIKKSKKPKDPGRLPRPPWLAPVAQAPKEIVVSSPADAFRMMRRT